MSPWSAVIDSFMGREGSEYHASISVSWSTLAYTPHSTHPQRTHTCTQTRVHTHTPWTTKADIRQREYDIARLQHWTLQKYIETTLG